LFGGTVGLCCLNEVRDCDCRRNGVDNRLLLGFVRRDATCDAIGNASSSTAGACGLSCLPASCATSWHSDDIKAGATAAAKAKREHVIVIAVHNYMYIHIHVRAISTSI
jgi:hypothetical protein